MISVVDTTVNEFGQSLGLPELAFNANGALSLSIEGLGMLFMERNEHSVLVYLARGVPRFTEKVFERALELCHYDQGHFTDVQPGLKGDDILIFSVRLHDHNFSLHTINDTIRLLGWLHDEVLKG